eukprot:SAG31_NODE_1312_length_8861_cov_10.803127_7_plen_94_part_00
MCIYAQVYTYWSGIPYTSKGLLNGYTVISIANVNVVERAIHNQESISSARLTVQDRSEKMAPSRFACLCKRDMTVGSCHENYVYIYVHRCKYV